MSQSDFINHKLKQVTWEDVEYPNKVYYHSKPEDSVFGKQSVNQPWNVTRSHLADQEPPEWFIEVEKRYKKFKSVFCEGDGLWTFYANYGFLAKRAGLIIVRDEEVIASYIVWLS